MEVPTKESRKKIINISWKVKLEYLHNPHCLSKCGYYKRK